MLLPKGKMKKHGEMKIKEQGKMPSAPQKLSDIILKEVDVLKRKDRKLWWKRFYRIKEALYYSDLICIFYIFLCHRLNDSPGTHRLHIQVPAGTAVTIIFRQLQSRCRVLPKKAPALIQLFHAEKDYRLKVLWTTDLKTIHSKHCSRRLKVLHNLKHSEMGHKPLK